MVVFARFEGAITDGLRRLCDNGEGKFVKGHLSHRTVQSQWFYRRKPAVMQKLRHFAGEPQQLFRLWEIVGGRMWLVLILRQFLSCGRWRMAMFAKDLHRRNTGEADVMKTFRRFSKALSGSRHRGLIIRSAEAENLTIGAAYSLNRPFGSGAHVRK